MSTQRAILITPGFTADVHDRNCIPTLQLFVLELLRQNVEVHVITLDYPFSNTPYDWHGATIHPCGGRNSRWLKPRTLWRAVQICQKLSKSRQATAIHSFWLGWASGIGEYVARQRGLRHTSTLMGQDVLPQNKHRFRFLSRERQQRLVVLSEFQNEVLEKHSGFRAAHVIPWGIEGAEIPSSFPPSRPVDILGVGSFIPLKNWNLWMETVAIVAKSQQHLSALLIGDGPEMARLKMLSTQLGLEKIVQFTGDLPRPQVLEKMQQAKVLLHTSNFESQGYVLSEAAMNGCRIVGTPVGIAPIMGSCAETKEGLAALIGRALSEPDLGEAVTPFLMSDTVKLYLHLYQ